jgi:uncharacterized membrane protein
MVLSPAYALGIEVAFYMLFAVSLYASTMRFGRQTTLLLLGGATIWTIIIENFIVLNGGYDYYAYASGSFPGYMVWVGVVPLWIILGWFVMTTCSYIITDTLLPGKNPLARSLLTALISLNIDLLLDPVAVATGLWRWTHPSVYIIGVPLTNLVGWFLIVFVFVLGYETKILPQIRNNAIPNSGRSQYDWWKMFGKVLRLFTILLPVVVVATFVVLVLLIPYSNLNGPFRNVFPAPFAWWS